MKSIFEATTREELISRISALQETFESAWGKMNAYQMVKHCRLWEEMVLRNKRYKRPFIGLLLGRIMLKNETKDASQMRRNNPTIPELIVKEPNGDFEEEKRKWIELLKEYKSYALPDNTFVHPFFGKMTREQIGYHAYKHTDHHLRQFKC